MSTKYYRAGLSKIDIIVHGRLHAFELARGLIELGHDVLLHTNYPVSVVAKFGVSPQNVRSFTTHGVLTHLASGVGGFAGLSLTEPYLHPLFSRWVARSLRSNADLIYGFSGVMEEVLRRPRVHEKQARFLVRGSSHIQEQAKLLEEEEKRTGVAIDRPSRWIIERELREYAVADRIIVLSSFAADSFVKWGTPASRIVVLPLGVNTQMFRASEAVIAEREKRILDGAPLRIVMTGTFSLQKGAFDLARIAAALKGRAQFRFVGDRPAETASIQRKAANCIAFVDRVRESNLYKHYQWADLFIFTTIQDGFASVLLQAAASGLPILATPNSSAPDFITDGETGWIVPIRDADAFVDRLKWCDENRSALAAIARKALYWGHMREWRDVAQDLLDHYDAYLSAQRHEKVP